MSDDRIEGLERLARERAPTRDLWPGIAARIAPRRRAWQPLAAAAGIAAVTLAVLVRPPAPVVAPASTGLPMAAHSRAIATANLDIADDAERQLQHALRRDPGSPALRRLLEATRQRQTDLRRLIAAHA